MNADESRVFEALAHDSRRALLDALFERDGQTLGELCGLLPDMTRFGCMKHLQVLEDAGLITSRKSGREKLHYLNPIPIQQVYDRWVSKYARPITKSMSFLKTLLEEPQMSATPDHVYSILIRTTPEKLWQAMIDGAITEQYYYQTRVDSTWQIGAPVNYRYPQGNPAASGEVLEFDPPKRLGMTFTPLWYDDASGYPVQLLFEIEPMDSVCKLSVQVSGLQPGAQRDDMISGFPVILSGLKSVLETGQPLFAAAPA